MMLSYTKSIICFFTFCFSMIYHHCIVNILFPRNLYNTSVNFFSVKFLPNVAEPKPSHRMHQPIYYAHCARAERCAHSKGLRSSAQRVLDNNAFNHLQLFTGSNPTRTWVEYGLHYSLQEKITMRRVNQYPISNSIW